MIFGGLMPDAGRLLHFPSRVLAFGQSEARREARAYLDQVSDWNAGDRRRALLESPDLLLAVCSLLRDLVDARPSDVLTESCEIYRAISGSRIAIGRFDERDYFLGESALLAGTAARLLGKRSESEIWLDRAEAGYRNTVNPAPALARVTYQRLGLRYEGGQFQEVSELAPMLATTFARLNMAVEEGKSVFLQGLALKESGRHEEAADVFTSLKTGQLTQADPGMVGLALVNLADIHAANGQDELASACYSEALPLLQQANRPAAIAFLKSTIGENLRRQGRLEAAVEAYRASRTDYENLGMSTWVAYVRIVTAQTLLESSRPREAEWEILAALETIDEQQMVPEGYAAVALLRESIRMRKADPAALAELRQYLLAKN
jgi:tetratricopeptide (TPR) repeat protein